MSLRKATKDATRPTTVSAPEMRRLDELWRIMNDVGITTMSTEELEEWSYLMARSLDGKGDPRVD